MPRMMRFEFPGSLVHIMARGIDEKLIFEDTNDREEFLNRLSKYLNQTGYRCHAWCLMPNHYHLFIRTNEAPMSDLMRPLNGGYARWFNKKHKRRGYLLQDRFKSVLCQDQDYARQLIRYIHLNPLRAGIVHSFEKLKSWKWCSHPSLLGMNGAYGNSFLDRKESLRRFGQTPRQAIEAYLSFLKEGIDKNHIETAGKMPFAETKELDGAGKGWPAIIGDPDFVCSAMERHKVARWRKHRKADYAYVLTTLKNEICREFSITEKDLFRRGWADIRSNARSKFCYRAHFEEMLPYSAVADFFGMTITPIVLLAKKNKQD